VKEFEGKLKDIQPTKDWEQLENIRKHMKEFEGELKLQLTKDWERLENFRKRVKESKGKLKYIQHVPIITADAEGEDSDSQAASASDLGQGSG
jgi:hypothetical protein